MYRWSRFVLFAYLHILLCSAAYCAYTNQGNPAWWDSNWDRRIRLRFHVNSGRNTGPFLTGFARLPNWRIQLDDISSDRSVLRVIDHRSVASGVVLPHEIYRDTAPQSDQEEVYVFFRISSLASTDFDVVWIYYKNIAAEAVSQDLAGLYSGFVYAHHFDNLQNSGGVVKNSVPSGLHELHQTSTSVKAMIGHGYSTTSAEVRLTDDAVAGSGAHLMVGSFTFMLWFRTTAGGSSEQILYSKDFRPDPADALSCRTVRNMDLSLNDAGNIVFRKFYDCRECYRFRRFDCRKRFYHKNTAFVSETCRTYDEEICYFKDRGTFSSYFPNKHMHYTCSNYTLTSARSYTNSSWHFVSVRRDFSTGLTVMDVNGGSSLGGETLSTTVADSVDSESEANEQLTVSLGAGRTGGTQTGASNCRTTFPPLNLASHETVDTRFAGVLDEMTYLPSYQPDDFIAAFYLAQKDASLEYKPAVLFFVSQAQTQSPFYGPPGASVVFLGKRFDNLTSSDDPTLRCRLSSTGEIFPAAYINPNEVSCTDFPVHAHGFSSDVQVVATKDFSLNSAGEEEQLQFQRLYPSFTYIHAPVLTSISPLAGRSKGNFTVELQADASYPFRLTPSPVSISLAANTVTCQFPPLSTGTWSVRVSNDGGRFFSNSIQYVLEDTIVFESVFPEIVTKGFAGVFVNITGSEFYDSTFEVYMTGSTGISSSMCTTISAALLNCEVPVIAHDDTRRLTVVRNTMLYSVNELVLIFSELPQLVSLEPPYAPQAAGHALQNRPLIFLRGFRMFKTPSSVLKVGNDVVPFDWLNSTMLSFRLPDQSSALGSKINISFSFDGQIFSSPIGLTLLSSRMQVASVSPAKGLAMSRVLVNVTGNRDLMIYSTSMYVLIDSMRLPMEALSPNSLFAWIPESGRRRAGFLEIELIDSFIFSTDSICFELRDAPRLSDVLPSLTKSSGGSAITILGSSLLLDPVLMQGRVSCAVDSSNMAAEFVSSALWLSDAPSVLCSAATVAITTTQTNWTSSESSVLSFVNVGQFSNTTVHDFRISDFLHQKLELEKLSANVLVSHTYLSIGKTWISGAVQQMAESIFSFPLAAVSTPYDLRRGFSFEDVVFYGTISVESAVNMTVAPLFFPFRSPSPLSFAMTGVALSDVWVYHSNERLGFVNSAFGLTTVLAGELPLGFRTFSFSYFEGDQQTIVPSVMFFPSPEVTAVQGWIAPAVISRLVLQGNNLVSSSSVLSSSNCVGLASTFTSVPYVVSTSLVLCSVLSENTAPTIPLRWSHSGASSVTFNINTFTNSHETVVFIDSSKVWFDTSRSGDLQAALRVYRSPELPITVSTCSLWYSGCIPTPSPTPSFYTALLNSSVLVSEGLIVFSPSPPSVFYETQKPFPFPLCTYFAKDRVVSSAIMLPAELSKLACTVPSTRNGYLAVVLDFGREELLYAGFIEVKAQAVVYDALPPVHYDVDSWDYSDVVLRGRDLIFTSPLCSFGSYATSVNLRSLSSVIFLCSLPSRTMVLKTNEHLLVYSSAITGQLAGIAVADIAIESPVRLSLAVPLAVASFLNVTVTEVPANLSSKSIVHADTPIRLSSSSSTILSSRFWYGHPSREIGIYSKGSKWPSYWVQVYLLQKTLGFTVMGVSDNEGNVLGSVGVEQSTTPVVEAVHPTHVVSNVASSIVVEGFDLRGDTRSSPVAKCVFGANEWSSSGVSLVSSRLVRCSVLVDSRRWRGGKKGDQQRSYVSVNTGFYGGVSQAGAGAGAELVATSIRLDGSTNVQPSFVSGSGGEKVRVYIEDPYADLAGGMMTTPMYCKFGKTLMVASVVQHKTGSRLISCIAGRNAAVDAAVSVVFGGGQSAVGFSVRAANTQLTLSFVHVNVTSGAVPVTTLSGRQHSLDVTLMCPSGGIGVCASNVFRNAGPSEQADGVVCSMDGAESAVFSGVFGGSLAARAVCSASTFVAGFRAMSVMYGARRELLQVVSVESMGPVSITSVWPPFVSRYGQGLLRVVGREFIATGGSDLLCEDSLAGGVSESTFLAVSSVVGLCARSADSGRRGSFLAAGRVLVYRSGFADNAAMGEFDVMGEQLVFTGTDPSLLAVGQGAEMQFVASRDLVDDDRGVNGVTRHDLRNQLMCAFSGRTFVAAALAVENPKILSCAVPRVAVLESSGIESVVVAAGLRDFGVQGTWTSAGLAILVVDSFNATLVEPARAFENRESMVLDFVLPFSWSGDVDSQGLRFLCAMMNEQPSLGEFRAPSTLTCTFPRSAHGFTAVGVGFADAFTGSATALSFSSIQRLVAGDERIERVVRSEVIALSPGGGVLLLVGVNMQQGLECVGNGVFRSTAAMFSSRVAGCDVTVLQKPADADTPADPWRSIVRVGFSQQEGGRSANEIEEVAVMSSLSGVTASRDVVLGPGGSEIVVQWDEGVSSMNYRAPWYCLFGGKTAVRMQRKNGRFVCSTPMVDAANNAAVSMGVCTGPYDCVQAYGGASGGQYPGRDVVDIKVVEAWNVTDVYPRQGSASCAFHVVATSGLRRPDGFYFEIRVGLANGAVASSWSDAAADSLETDMAVTWNMRQTGFVPVEAAMARFDWQTSDGNVVEVVAAPTVRFLHPSVVGMESSHAITIVGDGFLSNAALVRLGAGVPATTIGLRVSSAVVLWTLESSTVGRVAMDFGASKVRELQDTDEDRNPWWTQRVRLEVSNDGGCSFGSSGRQLMVTKGVRVASFEPRGGVVTGGTSLVVGLPNVLEQASYGCVVGKVVVAAGRPDGKQSHFGLDGAGVLECGMPRQPSGEAGLVAVRVQMNVRISPAAVSSLNEYNDAVMPFTFVGAHNLTGSSIARATAPWVSGSSSVVLHPDARDSLLVVGSEFVAGSWVYVWFGDRILSDQVLPGPEGSQLGFWAITGRSGFVPIGLTIGRDNPGEAESTSVLVRERPVLLGVFPKSIAVEGGQLVTISGREMVDYSVAGGVSGSSTAIGASLRQVRLSVFGSLQTAGASDVYVLCSSLWLVVTPPLSSPASMESQLGSVDDILAGDGSVGRNGQPGGSGLGGRCALDVSVNGFDFSGGWSQSAVLDVYAAEGSAVNLDTADLHVPYFGTSGGVRARRVPATMQSVRMRLRFGKTVSARLSDADGEEEFGVPSMQENQDYDISWSVDSGRYFAAVQGSPQGVVRSYVPLANMSSYAVVDPLYSAAEMEYFSVSFSADVLARGIPTGDVFCTFGGGSMMQASMIRLPSSVGCKADGVAHGFAVVQFHQETFSAVDMLPMDAAVEVVGASRVWSVIPEMVVTGSAFTVTVQGSQFRPHDSCGFESVDASHGWDGWDGQGGSQFSSSVLFVSSALVQCTAVVSRRDFLLDDEVSLWVTHRKDAHVRPEIKRVRVESECDGRDIYGTNGGSVLDGGSMEYVDVLEKRGMYGFGVAVSPSYRAGKCFPVSRRSVMSPFRMAFSGLCCVSETVLSDASFNPVGVSLSFASRASLLSQSAMGFVFNVSFVSSFSPLLVRASPVPLVVPFSFILSPPSFSESSSLGWSHPMYCVSSLVSEAFDSRFVKMDRWDCDYSALSTVSSGFVPVGLSLWRHNQHLDVQLQIELRSAPQVLGLTSTVFPTADFSVHFLVPVSGVHFSSFAAPASGDSFCQIGSSAAGSPPQTTDVLVVSDALLLCLFRFTGPALGPLVVQSALSPSVSTAASAAPALIQVVDFASVLSLSANGILAAGGSSVLMRIDQQVNSTSAILSEGVFVSIGPKVIVSAGTIRTFDARSRLVSAPVMSPTQHAAVALRICFGPTLERCWTDASTMPEVPIIPMRNVSNSLRVIR
eukprot:ANDGO_00696.mRNA.1 hypothetical protein